MASEQHQCTAILPPEIAAAMEKSGIRTFSIIVTLDAPTEWGLTVAEAARKHMADRPPPVDADDERLTLNAAEQCIRRACNRGELACVRASGARRIDPTELDRWRLRWRERQDLD